MLVPRAIRVGILSRIAVLGARNNRRSEKNSTVVTRDRIQPRE